ncbi:MAG TPA: hypothetical protein VG329_01755 [Candidatus Dormibacteraeota bacterium]|nr:hypothetical protein [Candidatus Dormibacteraeota bacterium]
MTKSGVSEHTTWGRRALRLCILASSLAVASATLAVAPAYAATASTATCPTGSAAVTSFSYKVGTTSVALNTVKPGDHVLATFTVADGCTDVQVTFAAYNAVPGHPDNLDGQTLANSTTGHFAAGVHTDALSIDIPCAWQADLVTGAVITKFDTTVNPAVTYTARGSLVDAGSGEGVCVTPSPTPTQSESPTSGVSGATTNPSTNSSVLGAAVVAPATGNGSEAIAGFIAVLMVLTGIAVLAEVRRRRLRD